MRDESDPCIYACMEIAVIIDGFTLNSIRRRKLMDHVLVCETCRLTLLLMLDEQRVN